MIVTIVGTGYVGLVTGACLASRGHQVRCVDVSDERIELIRSGKAPFYEPGLEDLLHQCQAAGTLSVTADLAAAIQGSEISLIAVGTPADGEQPDLSYLKTAAGQIGANLKNAAAYHVVAVKSTVAPGTTRDAVRMLVEEKSGRKAGQFGLCMNPEFLREGSAVEDFMNPDRVVIGELDAQSGRVMEALYDSFECEKLHVSLEEAELTKYASNSLLATMISFANELAALCEVTPEADVETVMDGLHLDHRLSPMMNGKRVRPAILTYLRAGIGFGGSCLPKDVNALRSYARRHQVPVPLLDAVMATNTRRPEQVASMAEAALGGLAGKTVALLGLAFKAGTDDLRSSPAIAVLQSLVKRGAKVRTYDVFITREAAAGAGLESFFSESMEAALDQADAALLTMVDPAFCDADWKRLLSRMRTPILIDGRNVLRNVKLPDAARYYPIGQGGRLLEGEPQWTA
jgi:UDPglucose 6-dehydrogenase